MEELQSNNQLSTINQWQ